MNDQNTMEIKTPVETSVDATVEMPAKTSVEMPIKRVTKRTPELIFVTV